MTMKTIRNSLWLLAFCIPSMVYAKAPPPANEAAEVSANVKRSQKLQMDGLAVVEAKGSKTLFVSTNGRFQFEGKITDIYTGKTIKTVDDAVDSNFLTLSQLSLTSADVAGIPYGNPKLPLQARVFVDPYCLTCQVLLGKLQKIKDRIHVEIMIAPLVSEKKSIPTGLNLWCAYEKDTSRAREIIAQLQKGSGYVQYPKNDNCKGNRVLLNSMITRILNVPGLPAFWREDGRAVAGIPDDIETWLKERRNSPDKAFIKDEVQQ